MRTRTAKERHKTDGHPNMNSRRAASGNMLTVVALTMGLIVAVVMIGLTFDNFMYQCGHAQQEADIAALRMATEINKGDRVAQLNELEECSRELLYKSRYDYKTSMSGENGFLTPLCHQLLHEARSGAVHLENERVNLKHQITKDIQISALDYNASVNKGFAAILPWLRIRQPRIVRIDVGYNYNLESNVKHLGVIDRLSDFDRAHGYFDRRSNLYRSNIDLYLPDGDNDLKFTMAPLAACINGVSTPARNSNPDIFDRTGTVFDNGPSDNDSIQNIPTAVQVFYSINASVGLPHKLESDVSLVSTGITNGAVAGSD